MIKNWSMYTLQSFDKRRLHFRSHIWKDAKLRVHKVLANAEILPLVWASEKMSNHKLRLSNDD